MPLNWAPSRRVLVVSPFSFNLPNEIVLRSSISINLALLKLCPLKDAYSRFDLLNSWLSKKFLFVIFSKLLFLKSVWWKFPTMSRLSWLKSKLLSFAPDRFTSVAPLSVARLNDAPSKLTPSRVVFERFRSSSILFFKFDSVRSNPCRISGFS